MPMPINTHGLDDLRISSSKTCASALPVWADGPIPNDLLSRFGYGLRAAATSAYPPTSTSNAIDGDVTIDGPGRLDHS